jgi:hypothetical protein
MENAILYSLRKRDSLSNSPRTGELWAWLIPIRRPNAELAGRREIFGGQLISEIDRSPPSGPGLRDSVVQQKNERIERFQLCCSQCRLHDCSLYEGGLAAARTIYPQQLAGR